ncbi:stimulator of interferon genes protein homolog [Drosophila biarmipes]|uniref:stimulator of interferon genes protein homolog n=1 Tax=Drosophila biarmipes TaxID=125945 RepID=UPI001CDAB74E|nr:stimulator of interferon genes protein homolog [Drosophila biarmipes]
MCQEMAIASDAEEAENAVLAEKGRKCFYLKKMIGDYIDTSVRIVATVFLADFLQRFYRCAVEYVRYSRYYLPEDRVRTIVRRSYTYNNKNVYLMLAFLLVGFFRISVTGNCRDVVPSILYLSYMPLYWIFSDLGQSTLSYSHWIRDSHGLDYAAGMASNYFHGYLKLSLPERKNDGLHHRMELYEDQNNVTFGIHRLVILIPDEMFVNGVLESDLLDKAKPLETKYINRAGVNRPFKHAVYRLNQKINGKTYYFAIEGATPMLSFFDAMQSNLSATWQMKELQREIWLKFYKHLKELITTWPETRNLVELIIYSSHDLKGNLIDVGELLKDHMENKTRTIDELTD